jgi:hypothetical protein
VQASNPHYKVYSVDKKVNGVEYWLGNPTLRRTAVCPEPIRKGDALPQHGPRTFDSQLEELALILDEAGFDAGDGASPAADKEPDTAEEATPAAPPAPARAGGARHGSSPRSAAKPLPWKSLIRVLSLPLFFALAFSVCYISAFHAPKPDHLPVTIVGAAEQTQAVQAGLAASAGAALDVSTSTDLASAMGALRGQDTLAVLELGNPMIVHEASGAGYAYATVINTIADGISTKTGIPVVRDDVAPNTAGDPSGTAAFYFLVIATIVGYLSVMMLGRVIPTALVRQKLGIIAGMSVLGNGLAYVVGGLMIGAFDFSAGAAWSMVGIGMLYTFTVGVVALGLDNLAHKLGLHHITGMMILLSFMIFLNFPSSGGAVPAHMLPGFWQFLHGFWLGADALEAMRSAIHFGGAGMGQHMVGLLVWLLAGGLLVSLTRKVHDHPDAASAEGSSTAAVAAAA